MLFRSERGRKRTLHVGQRHVGDRRVERLHDGRAHRADRHHGAVRARRRCGLNAHRRASCAAPAAVCFGVASAILIESSLSFLGYGMQAPTPSWGDILNQARSYIDFAWWLAFFPGLAILITIMSYNFVGEGLRDAVDPRLKVK